ncbi:MAG: SDR family NAD(P)-dependent oxidoreductase [Trueperaceae bacterium]
MTTNGSGVLDGRVVLVTGAARGIGEAIARGMAKAGAWVGIGDLDEDMVHATARDIGESLAVETERRPFSSRLDVSDPSQVREWIDEVVERCGQIDVLVNNAGVQLNRASVDLTDDEWQFVLGVNLTGAFTCSREAGRHMLTRGRGVILNVASIAERFGMPRRLPYCVAKAGLAAMTRVLAAEWAQQGIRVNAIAPGYVETELVSYAFSQGHIDRAVIEAKIPMGRLAAPSVIAESAIFLASDNSSYTTGQVVYVDGGYSIYK